VGKKRLEGEAVLAAAALPAPAPLAALLPDPTDTDLLPWDEPWFQALLDRLAGAELYLQDEVSIPAPCIPPSPVSGAAKGGAANAASRRPGRTRRSVAAASWTGARAASMGPLLTTGRRSPSVPNCAGRSSAPRPGAAWPSSCWTLWASIPPTPRRSKLLRALLPRLS
jgi:hypothetical protein